MEFLFARTLTVKLASIFRVPSRRLLIDGQSLMFDRLR